MPALRTLFAVALLSTGCRQIDPAPAELGAISNFFFTDFETAEDETMAEAVRNFDALVDGGNLEYQEGFLDALPRDATDATGYDHADPADAVGLFMVNPIACTMDQMVELVTMKEVVETYGVYESFDREWTSDIDGFRSMDAIDATWMDDFHYKSGLLGIDYTATTDGAGRWVPELDEEQTPWGPILLTRRSMIEPAVNADGKDEYPQDWRAEVYYERSNGQIVHLAAMWREAVFGTLSSEDELAQRTMLNGLKDWDKDSDKACEDM